MQFTHKKTFQELFPELPLLEEEKISQKHVHSSGKTSGAQPSSFQNMRETASQKKDTASQ